MAYIPRTGNNSSLSSPAGRSLALVIWHASQALSTWYPSSTYTILPRHCLPTQKRHRHSTNPSVLSCRRLRAHKTAMIGRSILGVEPHFQREECLFEIIGSDNTTGFVDPEPMACGDFVNPGAFDIADWPFDQYQEIAWLYWKGDPGAQFKPTPEHPREFPFDNQNTLWNLDVVLANDNTTIMINLFSTSRLPKELSSTTMGARSRLC